MKKSLVLFLITLMSATSSLMAARLKEIPVSECNSATIQRMNLIPETQKQQVLEAAKLWCMRSTSTLGSANAQKAANIYKSLATSTAASEMMLKGEYLLRQSEALYFVGDVSTVIDDKKVIHQAAFEAAEAGFKPFETLGVARLDVAQKTLFAELYYYYGANKGRWGEANGILNSLREWPAVKAKMEKIIEMGMAEVFDYGPNRVLGRAYFKLPFPLGSNKKALEYLQEAFENTLHDNLFASRNGVNNYFYADALITDGQKDLAKEILEQFQSVGENLNNLREFNPDRMPESLFIDLVEADKVFGRL